MGAVKSVPFTTPDDVERELRFTNGSRRRIAERFGSHEFVEIVNTQGEGALSGLLFACMFDEEGEPPEDLTEKKLAEMLPGDESEEQFAAFLSCVSQGRQSKNELAAAMREAMKEAQAKAQKSTGSTTGPLPRKRSASRTKSSGTRSGRSKSTPALSDSTSSKESKTTGPESTPPQPTT